MKQTEEDRQIGREQFRRAVENAKKVLKPGDRLRVAKCPGTKRMITFAGWEGNWIVSKSGISDYAASCVDRVNGAAVDFEKMEEADSDGKEGPIGARSGKTFAELYEMSQSPRMEWSKRTGDPIYYHTNGCKAQRDHKCGMDCMGSFGSHAAQDAADIRLAGWKPRGRGFPQIQGGQ